MYELKYSSDLVMDIVDNALNNLKTEELQKFENHYPSEHFFDQFRHIKINLPRRSGHTNAAIGLITKYTNSVLFVPNYVDKKYIVREAMDNIKVPEYIESQVYKFYDETIKMTNSLRSPDSKTFIELAENQPYDLIIVDMAERVGREQLDMVREVAIGKTKIYVELQ